jgi:hypothetical protein
MASAPTLSVKSTCQFKKVGGELCKRAVRPPEKKCWQHASSFRHRWKSLTQNQSVAFMLGVLGLVLTVVFGIAGLHYSYSGSPDAKDSKLGSTAAPNPEPKSLAPKQEPQLQRAPGLSKTDASQKPTDLGVHSPNETLAIPPNSSATISNGKPSPEDLRIINQMEQDYLNAKAHLEREPNKLVLHDLFLTDFSSIDNTASNHSGFTVKNGDTGTLTHVEYIVVRQLETGTKFLKFYILYTNETERICESLANLYETALNDFLEGRVDAEKIPGDSDQTTSRTLVFSNRIFIYHEAYLSPEQGIAIRDIYKTKGITVILRSTDYLSNKQLSAKVKVLEKKP